jgi:tRNA dimethylallyltransferase
MQNKVFVISGPTASGKTSLAIEVAKKFNGVVLNADSCQIYKGLPILSAQPNKEELSRVEHRLYGILEPTENNTVFKWLELIKRESEEIMAKNKNVVIVGGTGMYISRLIDGIIDLPSTDLKVRKELNELYEKIGGDEFYKKVYEIDEETVLRLNKNDKHRLIKVYEIYRICGRKMSSFKDKENKKLFSDEQIIHINLFPDREILYERCERRFLNMVNNDAVIDEVRLFIEKYKDILNNGEHYYIYNTLGFREIRNYLEQKISIADAIHLSIRETKNYAKRQYTWFKNQFKNVDFLFKSVFNEENRAIFREII